MKLLVEESTQFYLQMKGTLVYKNPESNGWAAIEFTLEVVPSNFLYQNLHCI